MTRRSFLQSIGLLAAIVAVPWKPRQAPVKIVDGTGFLPSGGTAGQVLSVNGQGKLAWTSPTAGYYHVSTPDMSQVVYLNVGDNLTVTVPEDFKVEAGKLYVYRISS